MKEKLHLKVKDTQKALENLIKLYEDRNKPDKAETYRKLLEEEGSK